MKLLILVLLLTITTDPAEIARINKLKKEAEKAYLEGNYELAIEKYAALDTMNLEDDAITLNLAHAYYKNSDTLSAKRHYESLTKSADREIRSVAHQQLGVMLKKEKKLKEALNELKESLRAHPANEKARYNYELVKKLLEKKKQDQSEKDQNKKDQNKDRQNKDQNKQKQDQQNKDQQQENQQKDQEGKEKEKPSDKNQEGEKKQGENKKGEEKKAENKPKPSKEEMLKKKLKQMNMSEEKAKMILEAMRNNEIQYLQQQRRKSNRRPKSDKPDW